MNTTNNKQTNEPGSFPAGLYGYVITDASAGIIEQNGTISNSIDEYAPYFNQLSALVADSFGFDAAEELVLFGKKQNASCMEIDDLHYAALFKSKAQRRDICNFLKAKGDENDVLA